MSFLAKPKKKHRGELETAFGTSCTSNHALQLALLVVKNYQKIENIKILGSEINKKHLFSLEINPIRPFTFVKLHSLSKVRTGQKHKNKSRELPVEEADQNWIPTFFYYSFFSQLSANLGLFMRILYRSFSQAPSSTFSSAAKKMSDMKTISKKSSNLQTSPFLAFSNLPKLAPPWWSRLKLWSLFFFCLCFLQEPNSCSEQRKRLLFVSPTQNLLLNHMWIVEN